MYRFIKHINPLFTGIFFLSWSMISFFVYGTMLKYLSLILGFSLIIFSAYLSPNKKGLIKKTFIFLFFYLTYLFFSVANEHTNLDLLNIIYGLVCISLVISGSIIYKNQKHFQKIPQSVLFFYSFLTIIGTIFFQSYLLINSLESRNFGLELDMGVNAIGVAYVSGILSLMFFSFLKLKLNYYTKIVLFTSLIFCILNILTTQSRGALIFLVLTFLLFFLKKIFSKNIFKIIFILIFLSLFVYIASRLSQILELRIDLFIVRLESLLSSDNKFDDLSSLERINYYNNFSENLLSYFPFGQYRYVPYPHNIFLEILMRFGLFGFPLILLLIRLIFTSIKYIINKQHSLNLVSLTIGAIFIFSFLQSLTSLTLEFNRMLWLGLGFYYSFKHE